ncbi:unnamed protein product, partial [Sphacelaria rigidula]
DVKASCVVYGRNVMSVELLEVSLLGVGTVLRLERDAWSTVKRLRQTFFPPCSKNNNPNPNPKRIYTLTHFQPNNHIMIIYSRLHCYCPLLVRTQKNNQLTEHTIKHKT